MRKVLVTGSRNFTNQSFISQALTEHCGDWGKEVLLIHGDCPRGVDAIVARLATLRGWWVASCPADWSKGPSAGPKRNAKMLDLFQPELVLAFPYGESKGTLGTVALANARGIPCTVFYFEALGCPTKCFTHSEGGKADRAKNTEAKLIENRRINADRAQKKRGNKKVIQAAIEAIEAWDEDQFGLGVQGTLIRKMKRGLGEMGLVPGEN
jgi:hypothetical protein